MSNRNPKTLEHTKVPTNPVTSNASRISSTQRDALERMAFIMRLLQELDSSGSLTPRTKNKLYWIQLTLIDVVNYVNETSEPEQE